MPQPWEQFQSSAPAQQPWEVFAPAAQDTTQSPGYLSRVGTDLSNRAENSARHVMTGGLFQAPAAVNNILTGGALDIAGETVRAATPDFVRGAASEGAQSLADKIDSTSIGRGVGDALLGIGNEANDLAKRYPETAFALGSIGNQAAFIPGVAALKAGSGAAGEVLSRAGGAIADAADIGSVSKQVGSKELKAWSQNAYKVASDSGGNIAPDVTNTWLSEAGKALPQSAEAKIAFGESPATQFVDRINALRDKPLSFAGAEEIDKGLGAEINKAYRAGDKEEALRFENIQDGLREAVKSLPDTSEAITQAKGLWSAAAKQREIEGILKRADQTDNPATAIKTGFRTLANNERRMAGYTQEEKALIEKAAKTGVIGDALKTFGSRLLPIVTAGAGGGIGEALAAKALSNVSRSGATALQSNRASRVINAINQRPVVQNAVKSAMDAGQLKPGFTIGGAAGRTLDATGRIMQGEDPLAAIFRMPPAQAQAALRNFRR